MNTSKISFPEFFPFQNGRIFYQIIFNKVKLKKVFFLSFFMLPLLLSASPDTTKYELNFGVKLCKCGVWGNLMNDSVDCNAGLIFIKDKIVNNGWVIYFLAPEKLASAKRAENNPSLKNLNEKKKSFLSKYNINSDSSRAYFFISFDLLERASSKLEPPKPRYAFTFGISTVPIKIRFGSKNKSDSIDFSFEGNANLGVTAGAKIWLGKQKNYALNLTAGLCVASTTADAYTTHKYLETSTAISVLSPSFNVTFEHNEFQATLSTGIDFATGELGHKWVYNSNLWLGVGLGYNLFNTKGKIPDFNNVGTQ